MPVELIVGAAVGAAAASSEVRKVVRKGVVYGLAGGLIAYDKVAGFASGIVRGVRSGVSKASNPEPERPAAAAICEGATQNGTAPAQPTSSSRTPQDAAAS